MFSLLLLGEYLDSSPAVACVKSTLAKSQPQIQFKYVLYGKKHAL